MSDINKTIELYKKGEAYDEMKPEYNRALLRITELEALLEESQLDNIIHGKKGYIHKINTFEMIDFSLDVKNNVLLKVLSERIANLIISGGNNVFKDKYSGVEFIETEYLQQSLDIVLSKLNLNNYFNINSHKQSKVNYEFINLNASTKLIKEEYLKSISKENQVKIDNYDDVLEKATIHFNNLNSKIEELDKTTSKIQKYKKDIKVLEDSIRSLTQNHKTALVNTEKNIRTKTLSEMKDKALEDSKIYIASLEITTTEAESKANELSIINNESYTIINKYEDSINKLISDSKDLKQQIEYYMNNQYPWFKLIFNSKLKIEVQYKLDNLLKSIKAINFDLRSIIK